MDKQKVIEIAKKNSVSIGAGVVALAAVVALYYPLGGFFDKMKESSDSLASKYDPISGLATKSRKLPIVDPRKTEAADLPVFPTEPVSAAAFQQTEQLKVQSTKMLEDVQKRNLDDHPFLLPNALPKPPVETVAFQYAKTYLAVLNYDPAVTGDPASPTIDKDLKGHSLNLQNDVLHGGLPPTPAEIAEAQKQLWKTDYEGLIRYNGQGQPFNMPEIQEKYKEASNAVPNQMKHAVAELKMMYVEKEAFTPAPDITTATAPKPPSIWFSQLGLWIQQDVAAGLADANHGCKNVLDARVKHLIAVQLKPVPMYLYPVADPNAPAAGGGGMAPTGNGLPTASPAIETAALPKSFVNNPTGRASNGMFDVVPFRLVIDVNANEVNTVIASLYKSRRITVTAENLFVVNNAIEAQQGRIYGDVPVVRLVLDCESLFMRSWTKDKMPDEVKQLLGLMPATPGSPGVSPMGGSMGPHGM